ncbi:hypothetical protein Tco_0075177 [Tanacetum coccineum]
MLCSSLVHMRCEVVALSVVYLLKQIFVFAGEGGSNRHTVFTIYGYISCNVTFLVSLGQLRSCCIAALLMLALLSLGLNSSLGRMCD